VEEGIDVYRMWVYVTPNTGTFRRSINYLSFGMSAVIGSIGIRDIDVCIASTPQFFAGVAGTVIKKLKRIPLALEVRDLWPDSIEAVNMSSGGIMLAVLRRIETFMYRSADSIVIVSPAFRSHIEHKGIRAECIHVVPNGVSTSLFSPSTTRERRRLSAFGDDFIVAYIGTFGLAHGLESAIEAARVLRSDEKIRFLFIGEGARKNALMKMAADLPNVSFMDRQARDVIAEILREIDVALVLLRDIPLFATVIPSKMFEIMGSGKPMILGVRGQAREILEVADAGIAVEPENVQALVTAIRRFRTEPELAGRYGKNACLHVVENYDLDLLAQRYLLTLPH